MLRFGNYYYIQPLSNTSSSIHDERHRQLERQMRIEAERKHHEEQRHLQLAHAYHLAEQEYQQQLEQARVQEARLQRAALYEQQLKREIEAEIRAHVLEGHWKSQQEEAERRLQAQKDLELKRAREERRRHEIEKKKQEQRRLKAEANRRIEEQRLQAERQAEREHKQQLVKQLQDQFLARAQEIALASRYRRHSDQLWTREDANRYIIIMRGMEGKSFDLAYHRNENQVSLTVKENCFGCSSSETTNFKLTTDVDYRNIRGQLVANDLVVMVPKLEKGESAEDEEMQEEFDKTSQGITNFSKEKESDEDEMEVDAEPDLQTKSSSKDEYDNLTKEAIEAIDNFEEIGDALTPSTTTADLDWEDVNNSVEPEIEEPESEPEVATPVQVNTILEDADHTEVKLSVPVSPNVKPIEVHRVILEDLADPDVSC